jgi:REP element-mobilizing transposase RayT
MRLRGYDYTQPGAYFVTVCTTRRVHRFGEVRDDEMVHAIAGLMVESWWHSISSAYPSVIVDTVVVMPNHAHGLLFLGADPDVQGPAPSLSDVIGWVRCRTTHDYALGVKRYGWPRFDKTLCQSRFHDHIVRTDSALERIRAYIRNNPSKWPEDPLHRHG